MIHLQTVFRAVREQYDVNAPSPCIPGERIGPCSISLSMRKENRGSHLGVVCFVCKVVCLGVLMSLNIGAFAQEEPRFFIEVDMAYAGIRVGQETELTYSCTMPFDSVMLPEFGEGIGVVRGPEPSRVKPALRDTAGVECRLSASVPPPGKGGTLRVTLFCNRRPDQRSLLLVADGRKYEPGGRSSGFSPAKDTTGGKPGGDAVKEWHEFYYNLPSDGRKACLCSVENLSFGGVPYAVESREMKGGNFICQPGRPVGGGGDGRAVDFWRDVAAFPQGSPRGYGCVCSPAQAAEPEYGMGIDALCFSVVPW